MATTAWTMERRGCLRALAGACGVCASAAGCVGGPSDGTVTMLAVNKHDAPHEVAVGVDRGGGEVAAGEARVAAGGNEELAAFRWRAGAYRVRATVDGDGAVDRTFETSDRFNALDVVVETDGSVELHRGLAA